MAQPTPETVLADRDRLPLRIAPVAQRIGDVTARRLAYNGSVPGPTVRVQQGSHIVVDVANDGDVEATIHWHGLRLENRYDGVPHETQRPIPVGGTFTYRVRFPDEGLYWYHPHLREDYAQDMGLYGAIVVEPREARYWPPADREIVLALDDVLIEDGRLATFDRSTPSHVAMGRFGNVLLVNGQPGWALGVRRGDVVRFLLVNTANTRVFDVAIAGARVKLVGGDSGRYEHETFVEDVILAPSERAIVDVLFDRAGEARLDHRTPDRAYPLGRIVVADEGEPSAAAEAFGTLRRAPELAAERDRIGPDLDREPDKVLALVAEIPMASAAGPSDVSQGRFACPMHPDVVSTEPGRCPKCGMKLVPIELVPTASAPGAHAADHGGHHGHQASGGGHAAGSIEWEDTMVEMNRRSTPGDVRWMLVDRETGQVNTAIDWAFSVGDRVKIRLVNQMDSDHPMHHPFHIHGGGRFLVLSRDGVVEPNLVWKDTVLIRAGETVDILLDVSNPGLWMAHCHIAEHAEGGMMFSFRVARRAAG
jgi:FtsP/CotA-like multicopper oxidase with cupredoxin domain